MKIVQPMNFTLFDAAEKLSEMIAKHYPDNNTVTKAHKVIAAINSGRKNIVRYILF